jgi:CheY-like chemotaxis protein
MRGSGTILLAEDDLDGAAMTTAMLTRLGYRVECWPDGAAARVAFEADPARWDLVVTDFAMPHASGVELVRAIKRRRPALPCILMTGYMEDLTEAVARQEGADVLLHKPIDPHVFAETVKRLIDQARAAGAP